MKIIHRGVAPTDVVYEGKCNTCLSTVEANSTEFKTESYCNETRRYCECPVCRESNMYFNKKVPAQFDPGNL